MNVRIVGIWLVLLNLVAAAGCATWREVSVGATGCYEEEITVKPVDRDHSSEWVAQCRGKTFLCGPNGRGGASFHCHERSSTPAIDGT